MNRFEYIVESIDGDYAHLRRTDIESDELKLVARALLPPEIMEGTKLRVDAVFHYGIIMPNFEMSGENAIFVIK